MLNLQIPKIDTIDLECGMIKDAAEITVRRLSDMKGHYQDQAAVQELLSEDPILYRVYMTSTPDQDLQLLTAMSVIEPGKVGAEYYMTKGHFHEDQQAPEVYLTLLGEGKIVMMGRNGQSEVLPMFPGAISYIPGGWAHRTINTGNCPLAFFCVWPAEAGHDYAGVADRGFPLLVLDQDGQPVVVPNPNYVEDSR